MDIYKVIINGAEIEEWSHEHGVLDNGRWAKSVYMVNEIETDKLTRNDVLQAIKNMLYHYGSVSENDLFDGNEDYFTFSRLENSEGEELEHGQNGYYVTYFVKIEKVEVIKAIAI